MWTLIAFGVVFLAGYGARWASEQMGRTGSPDHLVTCDCARCLDWALRDRP